MFLPFLHECKCGLGTVFLIQKIGKKNIEFSGSSMFMHEWQNLDFSLGLTDRTIIFSETGNKDIKCYQLQECHFAAVLDC